MLYITQDDAIAARKSAERAFYKHHRGGHTDIGGLLREIAPKIDVSLFEWIDDFLKELVVEEGGGCCHSEVTAMIVSLLAAAQSREASREESHTHQ